MDGVDLVDGSGASGVFICVNLRLYSRLVLGANKLAMDSKMVSLAFL